MESVPKIIHQTWKTDKLPEEWERFAQSWRDMHPDWEYMLWTDASAHDFVQKHYPSFLQMYDGYDFNIERADAIRYFVLHKLGGVYVDLDMECIKPIDQLALNYSCFLASEPEEHLVFFERVNKADKPKVCNAFMGSVAGHKFWDFVLERLRIKYNQQYDHLVNDDFLVIERTGPGMLTEAIEAYEKTLETDVRILDSKVVNPLPKGNPAFDTLFKNPVRAKEHYAQNGSLAIHYWNSTWWPPKSELVLKNDHPNEIKGFRFYQGKRSVKYKLCDLNLTRDVKALSDKLREDNSIVAFDTDGNTMSEIDLPVQWEKRLGAAANEGIYLKRGFSFRLKLIVRELPYYISDRLGFMHWATSLRKPFSFIYHKLLNPGDGK